MRGQQSQSSPRTVSPEHAQALERYLAARAAVDGGAASGPAEAANRVLDALHALTSLRAALASGLASGAPFRQSNTFACQDCFAHTCWGVHVKQRA